MARLTALLLSAAIAAVGCGSTDETKSPSSSEPPTATAAPQSGDVEGCGLITQAEVSAAVGATVGAGEEHSLRGCTWRAEPGTVVRLVVYPAGAETCKGQEFLVTGRQEKVPDLGDSALWGSSGDLVVCSGKGVFKLDLESRNDPRKDKEALISMGKAVLGRL